MSDGRELRTDRCPLCGNDNTCGIAAGATTCWCFEVNVAPAALARVPADARDKACLCAACARATLAPQANDAAGH